jgi:HTH-type transcriptional regulator, sugar sensing transcriptional regulator
MNTDVLEQLGLTEAESKVYLALLELGSSQAGKITSKTGIHRRTVYDTIERLIEKGLVSFISQNNIKFFEAVDPYQLLEILKERQDNLKQILPQLDLLHNSSKEKQETTFFRGKLGLKSVFNHQIEVGKEILVFGASVDAPNILKAYFPHYDRERVKKKISVKIVFDESVKNNDYIKSIPNADIKFIPKEYSSPAAINVYGDNVAIILWSEEPIAILIKNKDIAKGYKNYFSLLWNVSKV